MSQISEMDLSIIKNMMLRKSFSDISNVIGIDAAIIGLTVKRLAAETGLTPWQYKIDEKKLNKPARPAKKIITSKVIIEKATPNSLMLQQREKRKIELERSRLKTRQVDYSKMISVKVDKGTSILINPGEDPNAAKEKYLKRQVERNNSIWNIKN